ncbi:uncharacterized protein [Cherax quadricarinatus]|uniref:uncharacterized protein isoform X2 n=1 Tax=Cherax quadricarinatus TaxID=27406 RepID=UPI00387EE2C4
MGAKSCFKHVRRNKLKMQTGQQLACYSCNAVFKDVLSAAEHTLECVELPTSTKKPEFEAKKKNNPNKVTLPRPPRTWIREYEAILLKCMRDHVVMIGEAKAKVGKKPYTNVMELLAKELQVSIGEWVNRKCVIKKWLGLLRRVRNFDALQKGNQMLGYLHLDPPEFYGSIKEIDKEIQKAKLRAQQGIKQGSGKKEEEEEEEEEEEGETVAEATENNGENFAVQDCKVEADSIEYVVESGTQDRKCIEVVDVGNTMIRKDIVLSVLNRMEQGLLSPGEIAQEFGIDEIFLELIKQRKYIIIQGIERCSLCHLLLGNKKDLVTHELQCSDKNKWVESRVDDKGEVDNFQFFPATVERLVQLVIETNPRENRRNTWKKIAFHLSGLQDGVTVKRCNQKWRNLVNQCRSYEQLNKWAIAHNYTHSRPMPEYYHLIMPYVNASEVTKVRPSLDAIRKFVSTNRHIGKDDEASWDESNNFNDGDEDIDESAADYEDGDLNDASDRFDDSSAKTYSKSNSTTYPPNDVTSDLKMAPESHSLTDPPNDVVTAVKLPAKSKPALESSGKLCTGEESKSARHFENDHDINKAQETIKNQANLIGKFENKLDNALVLLRDMARENQRVIKAAGSKSDVSMASVGEKICKVLQVQIEMQTQMSKRLEAMTCMWERHHRENLGVMKSLIAEISHKNVSKFPLANPTDHIPKLNQSISSTDGNSNQTHGRRTTKPKPDKTCDKRANTNQICKSSTKSEELLKGCTINTTKPDQNCNSTHHTTSQKCIMTRKRNQTSSSDTSKLGSALNSTTKTNQECENKISKSECEGQGKRIKKRKIIPDY